jgi:hypothetical protein
MIIPSHDLVVVRLGHYKGDCWSRRFPERAHASDGSSAQAELKERFPVLTGWKQHRIFLENQFQARADPRTEPSAPSVRRKAGSMHAAGFAFVAADADTVASLINRAADTYPAGPGAFVGSVQPLTSAAPRNADGRRRTCLAPNSIFRQAWMG